ncbi:hypothetical protein SeMB42_g01818 [Synchytrium endobioticum]|uniref:Uncharacterized protein n=1 Tax=Synchytrium endobioticum TaxID=286115 RepID=A0A507DJC9_9FUNG|nr:hypothetical protein SeMB42_g01818 [Synchytrium endobioticum]
MFPPSTSMGIKYFWKYLTSLNVVKEKLGNIPGKAIVTNVKIFQKIKEEGDYLKEEMLKKTTPMKCPVPPVLKISPKVVEFDSDKYEEVKEVPKVKAVKPSSKVKAKRAPSGRSSRKIVEKDDSDEETSKKTSPMRPEPL